MTDAQSILQAATQLPTAERVLIVEALLNSLPDEGSDDQKLVVDEWKLELRRRSDELKSGQVQPISWSTVREDGLRLLDGNK